MKLEVGKLGLIDENGLVACGEDVDSLGEMAPLGDGFSRHVICAKSDGNVDLCPV